VTTTPLLRLEDVHTYYGNIQALRGLSITVNEGEVVTLIGSNGAGKTTTLRTIAGVLRPRRGSIMFGDIDLTRVKADRIVRLGLSHAPEGRRIFPRMTVRENLEMGAFARSDSAGIAEDFDRTFRLFPRLKERLTQVAGTLSGGEQQMLAIGRALMARPKIVLLDEPSMGLAPILVETIFQIIKDINTQGTTVLLVEQNAHMALSVATRGYVLQTGRIVLHDTSERLRANEMVRKAYLGEE
jgi:branched-chain amino acid transport system ATP-binding protein